MKKTFLFTFSLALLFIASGCQKETTDNTALCHNGIRDGNETEIDCNGDCEPCAGTPFLSCTMAGTPVTFSGVAGQTLNPSVRIYGVGPNSQPMNFMFIPKELNQPLPIVSVALSYDDEPYLYGERDTGSVVIHSIDTLRNIISGTFSFSARRVTKNTTITIQDGVFTNVRYGR